MEHICYAVGGWLFAVACWRLLRDTAPSKQTRGDKQAWT
jgi:hypothetical protein